MDQNQMDLFKTVCLLQLMQHRDGLIGKAPKYILEKMKASKDPRAAWNMLDKEGQLRICDWADKWHFPLVAVIEELQKLEVTS